MGGGKNGGMGKFGQANVGLEPAAGREPLSCKGKAAAMPVSNSEKLHDHDHMSYISCKYVSLISDKHFEPLNMHKIKKYLSNIFLMSCFLTKFTVTVI